VRVWLPFVGTWLLVAGPLLQAVLEIREEGVSQESVHAATAGITPSPSPSGWWWLLPPVMIVKRRHRSRAFWQETFAALSPDQAVQLAGMRPRTYGWSLVALGAACLATDETWELTEHYDWPAWSAVAIVAMLGALAVVNAVVNTSPASRSYAADAE
jgi:hypothetical protein